MSDSINHPKHYAGIEVTIECIDLTRHLSFQLGNAVKYLWRAGKKGGREKEIEDLKKAIWYLQDYQVCPVDFDRKTARAILGALVRGGGDFYICNIIRNILDDNIDSAIYLIKQELPSCGSKS